MLFLSLIFSALLAASQAHAGDLSEYCAGRRGAKLLTFTVAMYMKPPEGLAIESAGDWAATHARALEHFTQGLPYFLMDKSKGRKVIFGYEYAKFLQMKIFERYAGNRVVRNPLNRSIKLYSLKTENPFHLVLCHYSSCKGLKDPITNMEISEVNEDDLVTKNMDKFGSESRLDLSVFLSQAYSIPKLERGSLCSKGGLGKNCFEEPGISCDHAIDEFKQLPEQPTLSCFLQKYLFYPSHPDAGEGNSLSKEDRAARLTFFLGAEASKKISSERRGDWVIRRIVFDPTPLCKGVKDEKDLYAH